MHRVNLLLANADRRSASLIEAAVLDVCYDQAAVHCVRTARVDELLRLGCSGAFELTVVAADSLQLEPSRRSAWVTLPELALTVSTIKRRSPAPLLAFGAGARTQSALEEAGADTVLARPLDVDHFKAEVRRLLHVPDTVPEPEPEPAHAPFWAALLRGLRRAQS